MTNPTRTIFWMLIFLALTTASVLAVWSPIAEAFAANPGFNGVIVLVLAVGIAVNFRQVIVLLGEIKWIEDFRRSDPERKLDRQPRLLAPMAQMLTQRGRGAFSLSTLSTRSLLDSIHMRLDESRDISRYIAGLLIFLGLLGTFWGLMMTVGSVGDAIDGMAVSADDSMALFESLKAGLKKPLSGMGVAFSSSLFGLAGSLIMGFLDLQSGHAQNRFFNELEDWLASITKLSTGNPMPESEGSVPAYMQALLEQTADSLDKMQRHLGEQEKSARAGETRVAQLTQQLQKFTETQAELKEIYKAATSHSQIASQRLSEDLRGELRLLNRTLGAALSRKDD